jgi:putative DNA methylase
MATTTNRPPPRARPAATSWSSTLHERSRRDLAPTRRLFGKDEAESPQAKRKKKDKQMKLFSLEEVESEEGGWGDKSVPKLGDTMLDRVHQSMILFAAGRGEALRRFLVDDGAGQEHRFWKLANALSALYPQGTDEKRWVDGVLARKKGLGL